ncbi:MAG: LemA family protein [Magnetospirillum sp. WYHS-4]
MAWIFDRVETEENPRAERLKRSEVLLSNLYKNEVATTFHVPPVPGLKLLWIGSILAVIAFSATLFYKFNAFIMLREEAYSKAGNLEGALQRRANLFSNLVSLTLSHAALEHEVFRYTARVRSEFINQVKGAAAGGEIGGEGVGESAGEAPLDLSKMLKGVAAGGALDGALGRLLAVVEQYPTIQSAETYKQAMTSLVEMENLIAERRIEYHMAVRDYNTSISKYPWYLLAEWTGFSSMTYFQSGKDPKAVAPEISSDVYRELMPEQKAVKGAQETNKNQENKP